MITVRSDKGKGRVIVVLSEQGAPYEMQAQSFVEQACADASQRTIWMEHTPCSGAQWREVFAAYVKTIEELAIRTASFVAFGASSVIAQAFAHQELKKIRTMVLVDPSTRAHPTMLMKIADFIEEHLPMGLPLRLPNDDFDGRSLLQRIRCPVLVLLTSHGASRFGEIELIAQKLPTSWIKDLRSVVGELYMKNLSEAIVGFQEVPAKCPQ